MKPILAVAAVVLLTGCDALSGAPDLEYRRVPGELVTGDAYTPTISVPAQIRPGVPVPVTVTTEVGGCKKPGDETEVAFVDGAVEIRPYDQALVPTDVFCNAISVYHAHTVQVTFPQAGPFLIRAVGRLPVAFEDGAIRYETQTYELGVVVR